MGELPCIEDIDAIIRLAIEEDIGSGDVTSDALFTGEEMSSARIVARQSGVFCGGPIVAAVYRRIDPRVDVEPIKKEGERISPGDTVALVNGRTKSVLAGERTALNFLQRMSGIATKTSGICEALAGTGVTLLDTRKTLPGFRLLDKYSVRTGGGTNHRMGLYDMVMIKDNHIKAAGGIGEAVRRVRAAHGDSFTIEVEATNIDEVREALESGADIIMLDNMDIRAMQKCAQLCSGRAKTEISGNLDEERISLLRGLKVDFISMGALTHSVAAFDFSMKFD